MTLKWLHEHSFLGALLGGNGKEERLRRAEAAAEEAESRRREVVEEAAIRTAQLTEDAAILAFGDDSKVDVPAIQAEVEAELKRPTKPESSSPGSKKFSLVKKGASEAA